MLGPDLELKLSIPEQTLNSLSFSDANPNALSAWVDDLHMANIGETARQLYQAIIELNQHTLAPNVRSKILESIRDPIHFISGELSKHYLNQSISLPEKQQKIANLSQALHLHLATGYKIVLMESLAGIGSEKVRKNFACAAHRLISEYGNILVRSCQLYSSPPKGIWKELHQVFSFSEAIGVTKYSVQDRHDSESKESRIDQAYKRNLLLSCCRPNQLRQREILQAYKAFSQWSDSVEIGANYSQNAVFVVNMERDAPPAYRSLMHETLTDHYFGFDTAELVQRLTETLSNLGQKSDRNAGLQDIAGGLNPHLLNHLTHSLGILTKRTFKRMDNKGLLHICAGLSASHYYTSGGQTFSALLMRANAATISQDGGAFGEQSPTGDAWGGAPDAGGAGLSQPAGAAINFETTTSKSGPEYPQHSVPLVNTSPGGYCLEWQGEVPSNVQAGEILAIRETNNQPWSIAVIRWIRHSRQKGTQVGIELLAPKAQPCGVQLLHKTGDPSEYLRGLLLPELSSIGQPATLITPRIPFQTGNKVSLLYGDNENKCILEDCIASTASFNQFKLSSAVVLDNNTSSVENGISQEDDFDSLWPSL